MNYLQYFVNDCLRKHTFICNSPQTPWNLHFFVEFSISKDSFALKTYILIFRGSDLRQRPKFDVFQQALICTLASSTNLVLKSVPVAVGYCL